MGRCQPIVLDANARQNPCVAALDEDRGGDARGIVGIGERAIFSLVEPEARARPDSRATARDASASSKAVDEPSQCEQAANRSRA